MNVGSRFSCWSVRLLPLILCLLPACQQRMAQQPSIRPDEASAFFPDGRAQRPLVPGTVARGHLRTDMQLYTGRRLPPAAERDLAVGLVGATTQSALESVALLATPAAENFVDTFPFPITRDVLQLGKDRYMIYCVVCHDPLGTGRGKIVERGYTPPPSYHIDRLRSAPVGRFFAVMTEGYGSMPDYRQQISPRERWAIAAYLRALQLSQHFPENELTAEMRAALDKLATAAGEKGP